MEWTGKQAGLTTVVSGRRQPLPRAAQAGLRVPPGCASMAMKAKLSRCF
jgi:hypothetical protein